MNAICLVIDRLHAGYLGAYGNTWIDTPSIDQLASESFVFDQAFIDSPRLPSIYRSYWQGWHSLAASPPKNRPTLPGFVRESGVNSILLTDDRLVHQHPLASDFDEVIQIDPPWQATMAGEEAVEETHLARCFGEIDDWLQSARQPFLLWCHLGSLGMTWDAPPEFRAQYWEEGDPELSQSAEVPDRMLAEQVDPDEVLGWVQAYSGQITLLDGCIGGLCETLNDLAFGSDTLLALTSPRGFPLGEHRRVGICDEALHGELIQVPLMFRFPDRLGAMARSQALVEPSDLWATLVEYWRSSVPPGSPSGKSLMPLVREEVEAVRDRLVIAGRGGQGIVGQKADRGIRTPAWYLRFGVQPELYRKPDDRWEANDVSTRCLDVVENLQLAAVEYEQALRANQVADLAALEEVLLEGLN